MPYKSTAKSIDGWVVKTTPGNVAGTFIDKAQEVVYIYTKTPVKDVPGTDKPKPDGSKPETPQGDGTKVENAQRTLPQAGERQTLALPIFGALLLLSLGGYAYVQKKKKVK